VVKINKVYTKSGDGGETGLLGGARVKKSHPRIAAVGVVDELNSLLGLVRCFNNQKGKSERRDKLEVILRGIQQRLFDIGSLLAAAQNHQSLPALSPSNVTWLEEVIDRMNAELPALGSFILPGGTPVNAFLHQGRTVCRRAEREICRLAEKEAVDPLILAYINRLSDALFVFGRWVAATMGEEEFLWQPAGADPAGWQWRMK
jgi:cob(I)alamin adenosyltransferase